MQFLNDNILISAKEDQLIEHATLTHWSISYWLIGYISDSPTTKNILLA